MIPVVIRFRGTPTHPIAEGGVRVEKFVAVPSCDQVFYLSGYKCFIERVTWEKMTGDDVPKEYADVFLPVAHVPCSDISPVISDRRGPTLVV